MRIGRATCNFLFVFRLLIVMDSTVVAALNAFYGDGRCKFP